MQGSRAKASREARAPDRKGDCQVFFTPAYNSASSHSADKEKKKEKKKRKGGKRKKRKRKKKRRRKKRKKRKKKEGKKRKGRGKQPTADAFFFFVLNNSFLCNAQSPSAKPRQSNQRWHLTSLRADYFGGVWLRGFVQPLLGRGAASGLGLRVSKPLLVESF